MVKRYDILQDLHAIFQCLSAGGNDKKEALSTLMDMPQKQTDEYMNALADFIWPEEGEQT